MNHHRHRCYQANIGDHAPGYLREVLLACMEQQCNSLEPNCYAPLAKYQMIFWNPQRQRNGDNCSVEERARRLIGQLWNCTDIMPGWLCSFFDLPQACSYATSVRLLKANF